MDDKPDTREPVEGDHQARLRDRLLRIAVYAAPTILALQGQAQAKSDNAPGIIIEAPVISPPAIAALGVVLATVGAYRLRKARKRATPPEGDGRE